MKQFLFILIFLLANQVSYAKTKLLQLPYGIEIGKIPPQGTYDLTNKGEEEKQKSGITYHIIENRLLYWTNERGEVSILMFKYNVSKKLPRVFRDIGLKLSIDKKIDGIECKTMVNILKKEDDFRFLEATPEKDGSKYVLYKFLVDNRLQYTFHCTTKKNILEIFGLYRIDISKYTDFDF